jgi:hypothetical protein
LKDLLEIICALADEREDVVRVEELLTVEEADWLVWALNSLQKREVYCSLVELGERLAAKSASEGLASYDSHGNGIGIAIRKGFRNIECRRQDNETAEKKPA